MRPCKWDGGPHRILGAIGIAKDEVGDADWPGMRRFDELGAGVDVSVHRLFDQGSQHGRHRFGVKQTLALSHPLGLLSLTLGRDSRRAWTDDSGRHACIRCRIGR